MITTPAQLLRDKWLLEYVSLTGALVTARPLAYILNRVVKDPATYDAPLLWHNKKSHLFRVFREGKRGKIKVEIIEFETTTAKAKEKR